MSRARDVANLGSDTTNLEDISSAYNAGALSNRNKIINGAMVIDQRNAGASISISGNDNAYSVDRWNGFQNTDGAFTLQQVTDAPAGFVNSLRFTTATSDASLGSTQFVGVRQMIEGQNVADLGFGTASAQNVTLSFWVKSSLTGTFGGALLNSEEIRSYPFSYTISAANTWEQKSVTITGDTTGTWLTTNGVGFRVTFGLGVGSSYSSTANAWTSTLFTYSTTGAVSVIGTLDATWYITGVQLEAGDTATPFEHRSFGQELALCQRYYQTVSNGAGGVANGTTEFYFGMVFPTPMRASPSSSVSAAIRISDITSSSYTQSSGSISNNLVTPESGSFVLQNFSGLTSSRFAILAALSSGVIQLSSEL